MANKTPTKTSFSKDKQPPKGRGKSERTKILEAMKRANSTEDEFYDSLLIRATNVEDNFGFKELLNRLSPIPKSVAPLYEFEFDENADSHVKASQILKAMADGKIPSDIGAMFINGIQSMLKIKEVTEIDEKLERMEAKIESQEQA